MYKQPLIVPLTLLFLLTTTGCSRPWVAANTAAVAAHEVVNSANEAVAEIRPDVVRQSRQEIVAEYAERLSEFAACRELVPVPVDCSDPGSPEEWTERWVERVESINAAEDAIRVCDSAVVAFSQSIVTWSETRTDQPPASFSAACLTLRDAFTVLLQSLEIFDIDYPPSLVQVNSMIPAVCGFVGDILDTRADRQE